MARSNEDIIRDMKVRSHQLADELRDIREGFRQVRDGHITVHNFEMMKGTFIQSLREMIDHSNRYQRGFFGTPNEMQQKDKQHEETVARYEKKIEGYKQELLQERKAKEEALTRVSSLASQLLTTPGSSEVTDVSDRNRPTRLAEDFKNSYDDEWTDGFEFLIEECKMKEEDAIKCLYNLLKLMPSSEKQLYKSCPQVELQGLTLTSMSKESTGQPIYKIMESKLNICHDICSEELQKQLTKIERFITSPKVLKEENGDPKNNANQQQGNKNQPKDQQQKDLSKSIGAASSDTFRESVLGQGMSVDLSAVAHLEPSLMDFRKTIAVDVLKSITPQDLIDAIQKRFKDEKILKNQHITNFLTKCFKLCWLMGVQYPPMEMDFSHQPGQPLKQDLFKVYRSRGDKIAYVVWPPVYLHHNGPVVCQGYAECNNGK